jgi:ketosteroid isomerase-like protein
MVRRLGAPLVIVALVAGACGDDEAADTSVASSITTTTTIEATTTTDAVAGTSVATTSAGPPTPALSSAEIDRLAEEAATFAREHLEAWPDVDAFIADYTDDYTFAAPTWSDYRVGGENVIGMLRLWESMTDYQIDVTAEYVSANGAAFEETWPGLQPPMALPPDPPVPSGLAVYLFEGAKISREDLWYRAEDNVAYGIGCFAVDECPALDDTVGRYITAWSGGDPEEIAALYSEEATFADSILGLYGSGSDAIGELAEQRFGSDSGPTVEVLDLYVWTDGELPPTDRNPEAGRLIGIAIHYRATVNGTTQEAIATLELGVKTETGFEADAQGLIHREDIYHSLGTLSG